MMIGLTVSQAEERLLVERRKRSTLTETISGLERSHRTLKQVFEGTQSRRNTFFGRALDINLRDWQGATGNRFHSSNVETINHSTRDYLTRLRNAISAIEHSIRDSNSTLTRTNIIISDLERVIATGGI